MKLIIVVLTMITVMTVIFIGYTVHKDDAELRAVCEASGGVFVEAREPLHACLIGRGM